MASYFVVSVTFVVVSLSVSQCDEVMKQKRNQQKAMLYLVTLLCDPLLLDLGRPDQGLRNGAKR